MLYIVPDALYDLVCFTLSSSRGTLDGKDVHNEWLWAKRAPWTERELQWPQTGLMMHSGTSNTCSWLSVLFYLIKKLSNLPSVLQLVLSQTLCWRLIKLSLLNSANSISAGPFTSILHISHTSNQHKIAEFYSHYIIWYKHDRMW